MGRCGFVVDRCGWLWVVLGRFGSFWVVSRFSNYPLEPHTPFGAIYTCTSICKSFTHGNNTDQTDPVFKNHGSQFVTLDKDLNKPFIINDGLAMNPKNNTSKLIHAVPCVTYTK